MDEESLVVWQDVLDEVAAGRPEDLACPHCGVRPLSVRRDGGALRVSCGACGRYIEGRMAEGM